MAAYFEQFKHDSASGLSSFALVGQGMASPAQRLAINADVDEGPWVHHLRRCWQLVARLELKR
jgi:hypothetical protein